MLRFTPLAILMGSLLLTAAVQDPAEPVFEGKPASHWARQLSDAEPEVRERAQDALTAKAAVPVLIALLKHDDAGVRRKATDCLTKIGPAAKAAARPLLQLLKSRPYGRDHDGAFFALGHMGPDVVPDLIQALQEAIRDPVYRKVAQARAALREESEIDPAIRQAAESPAWHSAYNVARAAAAALARIGPDAKDAVPILIEAMREGTGSVPPRADTARL